MELPSLIQHDFALTEAHGNGLCTSPSCRSGGLPTGTGRLLGMPVSPEWSDKGDDPFEPPQVGPVAIEGLSVEILH